MDNRPRGREKNVTGAGHGLNRRGSGLNTGPVGGPRGSNSGSGGGKRSAMPGGSSLIVMILVLLLGGGGGIGSLLLGGGSGGSGGSGGALGGAGSLLSSFSSSANSAWKSGLNNTGKLNTAVASGSRDKYTQIKGGGADTVTIMMYMCGTDLESKYGMASNDLTEMANASLGDNVNIIVYTGGCTGWKTSSISSSTNQIYQVKNGKLICLSQNEGDKAMTDPATLSGFIKWCAANYPANRCELIFWDHGGGSVTGYGYDQKHSSSGSMTLAGIDQALKDGGVKFDFIGFDACLMATAENALMLSKYGDYMIASEETEPGVGWYYTNWLNDLSKNTSMPTIEIGQKICDDFVNVCAQQCKGQKTTLSVVDLAEVENTMPDALTNFARSTSTLITNKNYAAVSTARSDSREFAPSSRIDQVDLANLAVNIGSSEGEALKQVILDAVKYNKTSSNMTNACGLSIYFPYQKTSNVDRIVNTYKQIGMNDEYSRCISGFAKMEVGGQVASGGTANPLGSLLGQALQSPASQQMISQVLSSLVSSSISSVSGLSSSNTAFLSDRTIETEDMSEYIASNTISDSDLIWSADGNGEFRKLSLTEEQWKLVHTADKNMFVDDGSGYIDLGLDNVYDFDEDGNLLADTSTTWLAIDGQIVPYYHLDTVDDGTNYTITGRIPAMLNGEKVNLIAVFDNENPNGYIAGAQFDYENGETEVIAKNLSQLQKGDKLDFVCDYYKYDGTYENSYYLGEQMTVGDTLTISDVTTDASNVKITYMLTDIYNQNHWTPVIE